MPKLIVKRQSEFVNSFRHFRIEVDGKELTTIGNGKEIELEVGEGEHDVKARIDWCSSPNVRIMAKEDEEVRLLVKSGSFFPFFNVFINTDRYLALEVVKGEELSTLKKESNETIDDMEIE